ncbi:MAG TPA: hypothetical protein VMW69_06630, partial [Spirochaetia bacterium]|nr:hypothetical protein [Spirochaetia bacterium]
MKGYRSALIIGLFLITGLRAFAQEAVASELIRSTDALSLGDEKFDGRTPVRWYPLAIPEGARISVRVASVDFTPKIVVAQPGSEARIIEGKNGTAGGSLSVTGNGGVRIGVTTLSDTSSLGQFTIKVSSVASAGRLSPGTKRSGALSYDDEGMESGAKVDWWPLAVRAGDRLAIVVESEDFSPVIVGTLASGVDLVTEPSPDGTSIVRFSAASDATFQLGVSSSSEGEEGVYQIAVFIPVSPTPLEIGKVIEGTLADNDDMLG